MARTLDYTDWIPVTGGDFAPGSTPQVGALPQREPMPAGPASPAGLPGPVDPVTTMAAAQQMMAGQVQVSPAMRQIMLAAKMGAQHAREGRRPAVPPRTGGPVYGGGGVAARADQNTLALRELFARLRRG